MMEQETLDAAMANPVAEKLAQKWTMHDLLHGKITPSELHFLLHWAYTQMSRGAAISVVAKKANEDRLSQPCELDQREMLALETLAYQIVPKDFSALELSPVNTLGLNSNLTNISQHIILATIRHEEVVADPSTVLTLECAKRRADPLRRPAVTHLATIHRSLRLQPFTQESGFTPHFKALSLCSGGTGSRDRRFGSSMIDLHVRIYLDLLTTLNHGLYTHQELVVYFSNLRIIEQVLKTLNLDRGIFTRHTKDENFDPFTMYDVVLPSFVDHPDEIPKASAQTYDLGPSLYLLQEFFEGVVLPLSKDYPHVRFMFDLRRVAGMGYYDDLCFKIKAKNHQGQIFPLADGGSASWLATLLRNRQERLVTSGFGLELFGRKFRH